MIWGNISRSVNGENVLGGVAYKNKYNIFKLKIIFNTKAAQTKLIGYRHRPHLKFEIPEKIQSSKFTALVADLGYSRPFRPDQINFLFLILKSQNFSARVR